MSIILKDPEAPDAQKAAIGKGQVIDGIVRTAVINTLCVIGWSETNVPTC